MNELAKLVEEIKKTKICKNPEKINTTPLSEGLSKKVDKAHVIKHVGSENYRTIIIEKSGKLFIELYNIHELDKKWINNSQLSLKVLAKELIHFLRFGTPNQKKYFNNVVSDTSFRNINEKEITSYLKKILK